MMAINSRASILVVAIACLTACHQKVTLPETVFPGEHWAESKPDQVGLDKERLKEFSTKTGGSGCVTRYGHLVHSWGHPGTAIDPGSVVKVIFSHLVLKSVKDGKLPSIDATAVQHEPALAALSASLGHKDARITWRHFLNQTACYGQTEEPGTAFDYNDFTMVLAWQIFVNKVYPGTFESATSRVLDPMLTKPLGCEDQPRYYANEGGAWTGRLFISPRDLCRLGLLYMMNGRWREQQIIAANTAHMAVTTPLPLDLPRTKAQSTEMLPGQITMGKGANQEWHSGSYSFLWWINGIDEKGKRFWPDAPPDTFGGFGYGGRNALVVIPSLGLVVSWVKTEFPITEMSGEGHVTVNALLQALVDSVRD